MSNQNTSGIGTISAMLKRYLNLLFEDLRFSTAEKLSIVLSTTVVFLLSVILITISVVFLSIALGQYLCEILTPAWGNFIVAGFYLLLLAILYIFRTALVVNPVSRFISRLILKAPEPKNSEK